MLHRLDHPDPQIENSHLAQRRIQRPQLLIDLGLGHGRRDEAARSIAPDCGLAPDLRRLTVWPLDRQFDSAGILGHRPDGMPEPDLAACRGQRLAQPLHQLMLRVDVVRPPAGQGGVVQQHRLVRRTELGAMIFGSELQDGARDALPGQQLHGAVLD